MRNARPCRLAQACPRRGRFGSVGAHAQEPRCGARGRSTLSVGRGCRIVSGRGVSAAGAGGKPAHSPLMIMRTGLLSHALLSTGREAHDSVRRVSSRLS
eukprot:711923-Prymnesium_polylepis.1